MYRIILQRIKFCNCGSQVAGNIPEGLTLLCGSVLSACVFAMKATVSNSQPLDEDRCTSGRRTTFLIRQPVEK